MYFLSFTLFCHLIQDVIHPDNGLDTIWMGGSNNRQSILCPNTWKNKVRIVWLVWALCTMLLSQLKEVWFCMVQLLIHERKHAYAIWTWKTNWTPALSLADSTKINLHIAYSINFNHACVLYLNKKSPNKTQSQYSSIYILWMWWHN